MKKEIILETAARLFAKNGYARTSTLVLAQEAKVAEGTIFRHFKSKEELFIALIIRLRKKMLDEVYNYLDMHQEDDGIHRVQAVIKSVYSFVCKNNADFALLLRDAPGCYGEPDSKAFEHVQALFGLLDENFKTGIEKGQKEGVIREDINAADVACILSSSLVGIMRTVHLGFLQPSENLLESFLACTTAMLEKK